MDYDEISQLQSEGFHSRCVLVSTEVVKENQEEMWGMFLMAYAENVPQVGTEYDINILNYLLFIF